ncbi:MAG TPA: DUF996 domain-containing protein, partial [Candidatus Bathyarchaeia archaeon]
AFVGLFAELLPGFNITDIQAWSRLPEVLSQLTNIGPLLNSIGMILLALVVLFLVLVITAFFLRRSFGLMAAKTGVGLFGTTGLLLLIGAILTIIVIGIFLFWIATLLLAIAFFSVRVHEPQTPQITA